MKRAILLIDAEILTRELLLLGEGYEILSASVSRFGRLELVLTHPDFPDTPAGSMCPSLDVTYTKHYLSDGSELAKTAEVKLRDLFCEA